MISRRIPASVLALLLAACSQAPMRQSDAHIRAEAAPPAGTVPPPVQISTILSKPKATLRPETYSVVVNNVKVQELLFALARDAKLNIDIHPGIGGVVTLNAIDQTLPQLLSRIAKQVDMRWELDGPNLVVMPDSPYLHVYKIDYVNMDRKTTGTVGVSGQVASGGGGSGGGGGSNTSTITVTNSTSNSFWTTLERNIKDILRETDKIMPASGTPGAQQAAPVRAPAPAAAQGAPGAAPMETAAPVEASANVTFREAASVIANPEAGVLVVRATSRQHEKIQEFLDQVMASAKRQVLIEATIAQVQLSNQYQQGIDWSVLRRGGVPILSQISSVAGLPSAPAFPNIFTVDARGVSGNLSAVVRLLDSFGTVRVLSSPKISVINNQPAVLRVVRNIVYFTVQPGTTVVASSGGGTVIAPATFTTTPNTVPEGLVMTVIPQISENDVVLLNVRPTITRKLRDVTDPNPALTAVPNLIPEMQTQEMESMIRVGSNQITVMGGLIQDAINDTEDNIPWLDRIPIIGSIFSSRSRNNSKTELVIFLRPVVVKDPSIDGDYRSFRNSLPDENFISRPNPGKSAP
jgi:general secretion pathway protein D